MKSSVFSVTLSIISRPRKGAWIEMYNVTPEYITEWSRPRKGAWIEIVQRGLHDGLTLSPPQGGVD